MFTFDSTIDAIQTGKKTFVTTFVANESVKDAMVKLIDAETAYTKEALKTGTETFTLVAGEAAKAAQNVVKFDYAKFGEGIVKAYKDTAKK